MVGIKSVFLISAVLSLIVIGITGCSNITSTTSDIAETAAEQEAYPSVESVENDCTIIEDISVIYRDTYNNCDKAAGAGPLSSLEILQHIVSRLGEMGYVVVDSGNQVNMEGVEQAEDFCRALEAEKSARLTVIVVMISGFRKFDLQTAGGSVTVTRTYYQYGPDDAFRNRGTVSYPASWWEYTDIPETASYLYRPRGFYETESPDIPWPEVVSCTENQDGTIELIVNAVYPNGNTSRAYTHRTVIRPQDDGAFQYVSNRMLWPEEDCDIRWHAERMTEEEWREAYGDTD